MKYFFLYSLLLTLIVSSCGPEKTEKPKKAYTKKQIDSMVIEMEKSYNKMEEDRIRDYISRHMPMERTQSGFYYAIIKKNEKGAKIEDLSMVRFAKTVSLITSEELYRDTAVLKVGQGSEISGMHNALKLLRNGESAVFIFPSYLAHGLLGDMNKVPPKSELVYEVTVLDVK